MVKGNESTKKIQLTNQQRDEIKQAFDLFDTTGSGAMAFKDIKVVMISLGTNPTQKDLQKYKAMISDGGKSDGDKLSCSEFLDIMCMKMAEPDSAAQQQKGFSIFSREKEYIELDDLLIVAEQLGETMSKEEIKEMVGAANGYADDGKVSYEQFLKILSTKV